MAAPDEAPETGDPERKHYQVWLLVLLRFQPRRFFDLSLQSLNASQ